MGEGHKEAYTGQGEWITDLVVTVAENTGCNPLEMTPPLAEVIDTDALQRLFQHSPKGVGVSFEYKGQKIDVRNGGHVVVHNASTDD